MSDRQRLSATESVLVLEVENEQLKKRLKEKDDLIKCLLEKILPSECDAESTAEAFERLCEEQGIKFKTVADSPTKEKK